MKTREKGKEKEKGKRRKGGARRDATTKKSLSVVLAIFVYSALIALMTPTAAEISFFAISPDTGEAGDVSGYMAAVISTDEFTMLDINLPAEFGVQSPVDNELIARVTLWNNTQYYGYILFRANNLDPANKVDVYANIGGDIAEATVDVDYSAGGTIYVKSPFAGGTSYINFTLPTKTVDGSLKLSLPMGMKKVWADIKQFVKNPTTPGDYTFDATVDDLYTTSDTVRIIAVVQSINITSPINRTYASTCVRLNFTVEPEAVDLDWIGYSLDGEDNVTITGNTTVLVDAPPYNHNIVVYATDNRDNTVASNTVFFTIHPADINDDCRVNVLDLQLLAWAFLSKPGYPNWNKEADLNCDNQINIFDLQKLAWNILKVYC